MRESFSKFLHGPYHLPQDFPNADLSQAYEEALALATLGAASGRKGTDAQLLRLMQRTGCCWGELMAETSASLLQVFAVRLQV